MKLMPGDLVRCNALALKTKLGGIDLFAAAPSVAEPAKVAGWFSSESTAIVIWTNIDSSIVYLCGPNVLGYTFGALLDKITKI